jgi:HAD superfamily hydrolase (TIGR01509 family)
MLKAALWDMDGTLVDSEQLHWLAWKEVMDAEGVAVTYQQFRDTFGQRNDTIIPLLCGGTATAETVTRISDTKEAAYRRMVREGGIAAIDGAIEWVKRLHEQGWRQAIASAAPRANIQTILDVLGLHACFNAAVAAEDVLRGKPDPQVFLLAAERLGVAPPRAIVVEDGRAGIEGARRAGMRSIGIERGGGKLEADLVVRAFRDLAEDAFEQLLTL